MDTEVSVTLHGADPADVFTEVATLDRYPAWMRLVHRVDPLEPDEGRPAWLVELRARLGPLARSKQLRMVRTRHEPGRRVRFERVQHDERDHAEWILTATVDGAADGARLTMELTYTGRLWATMALERALEEEVRRAEIALGRLVTETPRR